ncbi:hypothetical protein ACHAWF_010630 [Thalassiosira exigua]
MAHKVEPIERTMKMQAKPPMLGLLEEHLLAISSFLSAHDIRSLTSSCHSIRRTLTTGKVATKIIWADRMHAAFPVVFRLNHGTTTDEEGQPHEQNLKTSEASFVSDYLLSVSGFGFADSRSIITLPLLVNLLAPRYPQNIDSSSLCSRSGARLFRSYDMGIEANDTTPSLDKISSRFAKVPMVGCFGKVPVVQFEGPIGNGDRCIRSDQPFPPYCQKITARYHLDVKKAILSSRLKMPRLIKKRFKKCIVNSSEQASLYPFDADTVDSLDADTVDSSQTDVECDPSHLQDSTFNLCDGCLANFGNDIELVVHGSIGDCESSTDKGEQSLFRRGMHPDKNLRPFVAPTVISNEANNGRGLVIDVTPRLVAYFEATIVKQDEDSSIGVQANQQGNQQECIAIGLSTQSFVIERKMPGWDNNSYGYHSDNGRFYHVQKSNLQRGPLFGAGDTVGCGFDYSKRMIFFTKNGEFLQYAFGKVGRDVVDMGLYPTVGVDSNCPVFANFGTHPFKFDLNRYGKEGHK